jgi:hypothetical protein
MKCYASRRTTLVKVKVKFTLEQAMKARSGSRGIAILFNLSAGKGGVVNAMPRMLYPYEKDPIPIVQEAGWAPWTVRMGAENLTAQWNSIPGPSSP